MTEQAVTAPVAPTFTVDGDLVRELARDCVRLEVEEGLEGLRRVQVHLLAVGAGRTGGERGFGHLDGSTVDFGRTLQIALGGSGERRIVFDGQVSALEFIAGDGDPPVVVLHAEDALMRLRMTRRTRTYQQSSDADIAREIAQVHGLQSDVDADGPTYDVVQQLNQSDLAFLRDRARLVQAEIWCVGRTVHFAGRRQRRGTEIDLVRGGELLSVRIAADLAEQRGEVVVTGWDASAKDLISERAGPDVVDAEIDGGRTGARLVTSALGDSASLRIREVALLGREAKAWAEAEMRRRARRFVTVSGTSNGSPDMVVGSRLTLHDVGQPFDGGGYYVTRVRHTFDLRFGFRTRFEAERPTVNEVRR
jgi:phage protein D